MSIFFIELAINLFAQCIELLSFEVGDGHALPSTAGAIERRVHQLQHRLFAEGVRNRLRATTLLEKQSFHEIGGPRGPPMRHRQLQVGTHTAKPSSKYLTALGKPMAYAVRKSSVAISAIFGLEA